MKTALGLLLVFVVGACASSGDVFAPTFPDNQPDDVASVVRTIQEAAPAPTTPPILVGLRSGSPPQLFAYDLRAGRELWQTEVGSRTTPAVTDSWVATIERDGLVIRDIITGQVRSRVNDHALHLIGADAEGNYGAVALSTGGGVGARSRLLLVRNGQVRKTLELDYAIGVPAVRANRVFVPWATQNLSVLDARSGREVARVRIGDTVVGQARTHGGDVYFGHDGLLLFSDAVSRGAREAAGFVQPDLGELPGHPRFLRDAYRPPPLANSALHKVRLEWIPARQDDRVELRGPVYYVFYRAVFALDPMTGRTRWAYVHDHDIVGAQANLAGLLIVDERGEAALLADGRSRWSHSTGGPIQVGIMSGADLVPSPSSGDAPPLADQLLAVAHDRDARLVPVRQFAIEQLAPMEGGRPTEHLITLCDSLRAPSPVTTAACSALSSREHGADAILHALSRHASFLQGSDPPPVAALAEAAAAMNEGRAVAPLLEHLRDPATPAADLPAVIRTLQSLGDPLAAGSIADFLMLYHADGSEPELLPALIQATDALLSLLGQEVLPTLRAIADGPLALPPLQGHVQSRLVDYESQQSPEIDAAPDLADSERGSHDSSPTADGGWPRYITAAIVTDVLAPVDHELERCLQNAPGRPRAARLIIVLEAAGEVALVSTENAEVLRCIEPIVRTQDFPGNTLGRRQQVIFTLRR